MIRYVSESGCVRRVRIEHRIADDDALS